MGRTVLVVGGTSGIGREIAAFFAGDGDDVILTGRDPERAAGVAAELSAGLPAGTGSPPGGIRGIGMDLSRPTELAAALSGVERVDHLVLGAIERDNNSVADFDVARSVRLVTIKLVGYTEVVHALLPRMPRDSSIVLFGGRAKDRPYPGSTTVSTINGGVTGLVNSLAVELAPIRVNAIHPGIVGDSPFWSAKPAEVLDGYISQTPTGRLATTADVVDAVVFLLRNRSVNGVNLDVDSGWLLG